MTKEDICAAFYAALGALDGEGPITHDQVQHAMGRQNATGNPAEIEELAGMIVTFGESILKKARSKTQ